MELKEAVVSNLDAKQTGSISVKNEGGYIARFTLGYKINGEEPTIYERTSDFILGKKKSLKIPEGAETIHLKVEEQTGLGWKTIFEKDYLKPVKECFIIYGTTGKPKYDRVYC